MIELFQFESCPYCSKVRQKLTELHVDWIARSCPKGSPQRKRLLELGGKEQVPFLYDAENNMKMYESDDIVAFLEEKYGRRRA